jgi:hypothetical protein
MDCPAIIFLVFNRPEQTRRVFERIRAARPKKLLVAADGPRTNNANDALRCAEVRSIFENIDWECDVTRAFSDVNKGCARAVSESITYGMDLFGEAIILEDDCLPDLSFFSYCSALLAAYRDDHRVICISGSNYQNGNWRGDGSFYFSKYPHCWGWATWERSWKHFDLNMRFWPSYRDSERLAARCPLQEERDFWIRMGDRCFRSEIDTWDIQWLLACWHVDGLAALPNRNLVENIGFGPDATHTVSTNSQLQQSALCLDNLTHPTVVAACHEADHFTFLHHYRTPVFRPTFLQSIRMKLGAWKQAFLNARQ